VPDAVALDAWVADDAVLAAAVSSVDGAELVLPD
jgi:hypothetical protein